MMTLSQIQEDLKQYTGDVLLLACERYRDDSRKSVQQYLERCRKQVEKENAEMDRLNTMLAFEQKRAGGLVYCGIDEAGRGPLAGPVVAAAVIMPKDHPIPFVNDSKKLSEKKREELYDQIMEQAISVGVGVVSEKVIDEINILQATYRAMQKAVAMLDPQPQMLINDAVTIPGMPMRQTPVIKGDAKCYSIAAASIIAKVTRDRMMREYDKLYPGYGFSENKGYGSGEHMKAIREQGLCPIHRRTFISSEKILNAE